MQHLLAMMSGPNNLEYDLASGGRGDRDSIVEELLCTITGAEAATVVNNNAGGGAVDASRRWHSGREVIVSRGELVEIGGAFRMPDVMASRRRQAGRGGHHQPHASGTTTNAPSANTPRC